MYLICIYRWPIGMLFVVSLLAHPILPAPLLNCHVRHASGPHYGTTPDEIV